MSFIVTQSFTILKDIISLCRSKFPYCIMFLRKCSAATGERNKTHPWSPATYSLLKAVWTRRESPGPSQSYLRAWQQCDAGDTREENIVLQCRNAGTARNWTGRTTRKNHGMPDQHCTWDDSRTPLQDLEPADTCKEGYHPNLHHSFTSSSAPTLRWEKKCAHAQE